MKKLWLIIMGLLVIASIVNADPWQKSGGRTSDIMGYPIDVLDVQVTKEVIVNGKAAYMYKFIIKRPSQDKGNGIAYWNNAGMNTRLHYSVSIHGKNKYWSIFDDREAPKFKYKGRPDLIIVYTVAGLYPSRSKKYLRVGALPYPMAFGYDLHDAIQFKRSEFMSWLEILMTKTSFAGIAAAYVSGKVQDAAINAPISRWISVYGQEIELEVFAKVPYIKGTDSEDAKKQLRIRGLKPLVRNKIYNPNPGLHNRVAGTIKNYGNRVRANTQIIYDVYTRNGGGGNSGGSKKIKATPYDNICGKKIPKAQLEGLRNQYKARVRDSWKKKRNGSVLGWPGMYGPSGAVHALSSYLGRDRYEKNIQIWKQKVRIVDGCVGAIPNKRPKDSNANVNISRQFQSCLQRYRDVKYMKCK